MPDDNEAGRQWIVEPPPGAGEISLYMACGEGVELTDEQQAALGALLQTLEVSDAEVTGHTRPWCPYYDSTCNPLSCGTVKCASLACAPLTSKVAAATSVAPTWDLMGSFVPRTT